MDSKDVKRFLAGLSIAGLLAGSSLVSPSHATSDPPDQGSQSGCGSGSSCSGGEKKDDSKSSCGGGSSCSGGEKKDEGGSSKKETTEEESE